MTFNIKKLILSTLIFVCSNFNGFANHPLKSDVGVITHVLNDATEMTHDQLLALFVDRNIVEVDDPMNIIVIYMPYTHPDTITFFRDYLNMESTQSIRNYNVSKNRGTFHNNQFIIVTDRLDVIEKFTETFSVPYSYIDKLWIEGAIKKLNIIE